MENGGRTGKWLPQARALAMCVVTISTQVRDSVIQRSTIGAGARKCPDYGREVEANEKFCPECGAKLG